MEDDDPSLLENELETPGLGYLSQKSNLKDCRKDIFNIGSENVLERCDVERGADLAQENRLKSRRLHNPYLIDEDAAVQESTLVPDEFCSSTIPRNEDSSILDQAWYTDSNGSHQEDVPEECKAVLELLDLSIQPHLTSDCDTEDGEVLQNDDSCDFISVATTTSILDTDEDSMDVCHSDNNVRDTRNSQSVNVTEPKNDFTTDSPVKLSASTNLTIPSLSTTKTLECACSVANDILVPMGYSGTIPDLKDSSGLKPSSEVTKALNPHHLELNSSQRTNSNEENILPFKERSTLSRPHSSEEIRNMLEPQPSGVLTSELSPSLVPDIPSNESPVELQEFSATPCPLKCRTPSNLGLPSQEISSATKGPNSLPTFEETVESTNSQDLGPVHTSYYPRPIPLENSPISISPVSPIPRENLPGSLSLVTPIPLENSPSSIFPITHNPLENSPVSISPVSPIPRESSPRSLSAVTPIPLENSPSSLSPVTPIPLENSPRNISPDNPIPLENSSCSISPVAPIPIENSPSSTSVNVIAVENTPSSLSPVTPIPLENSPGSLSPITPIPLENSPSSISLVTPIPSENSSRSLSPVTPIPLENSPRSLSPVEILDFLRPSTPDPPIPPHFEITSTFVKPQSDGPDDFLRAFHSEQEKGVRPLSCKELPSYFNSKSPSGINYFGEEATSSFRQRPLSEQLNVKYDALRPLSQIETTTSNFPVPSQSSPKLLASSKLPVDEFLRANSPSELFNILEEPPNSSVRQPAYTDSNRNGELTSGRHMPEGANDNVSSSGHLLRCDPGDTSGESRRDGSTLVQITEESVLQPEEVEEANPRLTEELRTEDTRDIQSLVTTPARYSRSNRSSAFGGEDAERGRRPSWLRASMRRVTHFQLAEPPSTLPPLATPETVLDILENNRRPNSAPASRARRADFPRRYSSYSATILNNSSSVTNLTQAAEPVAVESPSSEDEEEDEEEEEDISSSSDGQRSPRHQAQQEADEADSPGGGSPLGEWPHNLSSMLASLGCTLGLFNISRFAILSIHFGANFIVQFLMLTLVLGIPLFTLNTCLGQCLCTGVMDMWHISPIFQGVGIALIISQALIGIYSIVGISWMFIYFRDSFITKQDRYRWAEPFQMFREDTGANGTVPLEQAVPDYLNGVVLQRTHLASSESSFGHVKFQVAFNLAVVWMIVFVSLSKGLKSYGKVVYVFSLFPVCGMLVLCTKLLGLTPNNTTHQVFPETVWTEFFLNTKSWVAALTEVFFTWGLLGAAAMQIASHNRHKHLLSRDTSLVIVLTLAVLLLAAFLANTCVALLNSHGYVYVPSSFEYRSTYGFLQRQTDLQPRFASTPVRYMSHTTLITGTRIVVPSTDHRHQSGYQVLRLATELVPATLALLGAEAVSPFWAVLFYFVIILFGIAQQLCVWHCVITGIMAINAASLKSWETTITFFSCAGGFILGLPMTTELGIFVVYFLDYTVGCAWWIMILYLLEIIAVFVVRGRPYSGETVVATLFTRAGCLQTWAAPMLIFTWNVILPITLIVMSIVVFKTGQFHDLYDWRTVGYEYWAVWTREVGCMLQILPVVVVPLVCVVQTCRYLSNGPRDILERIQLLYRPSMARQDLSSAPSSPANSGTSAPPITNVVLPTPAAETSVAPIEDPPPKYTPPPSYTTATGARIAKLLRQSFRRSMRRLTNVLNDNSNNAQPPPPDYAAVLVEINRSLQDQDEQEVSQETSSPAIRSSRLPQRTSTMTAADVANILRSSMRRNIQRNIDAERLVDGAAPIHHDGGSPPPASRVETESKP